MLDEICGYLRNWFDRDMPKYSGRFVVEDGQITFPGSSMEIQQKQYFRVIGSVFNDGVWQYGVDSLTDESFNGTVWLMAIPSTLIALAADIAEWQEKYGSVSSSNMSPYSSESFGGYSYTKSQGSAADGGGAVAGWQSVFGARLMRWKKL